MKTRSCCRADVCHCYAAVPALRSPLLPPTVAPAFRCLLNGRSYFRPQKVTEIQAQIGIHVPGYLRFTEKAHPQRLGSVSFRQCQQTQIRISCIWLTNCHSPSSTLFASSRPSPTSSASFPRINPLPSSPCASFTCIF